MNSYNKNLFRAMEILERVTPLKNKNCGKLCGACCCKGSENDGMYLFPGEYELLLGEQGFSFLDCEGNFGQPMLVCRGQCDRKKRPLACRFFPLFPLAVEHNSEVKIIPIPDPRASICPLLSQEYNISKQFYRSVRLAGKYLVRDEVCLEYLLKLSAEIMEISELANKIK